MTFKEESVTLFNLQMGRQRKALLDKYLRGAEPGEAMGLSCKSVLFPFSPAASPLPGLPAARRPSPRAGTAPPSCRRHPVPEQVSLHRCCRIHAPGPPPPALSLPLSTLHPSPSPRQPKPVRTNFQRKGIPQQQSQPQEAALKPQRGSTGQTGKSPQPPWNPGGL